MFQIVINFFDKFEDHVRGHLSRYPIIYSLIGGVAIVLFWRGIWHTADILEERGGVLGWFFYEPVNLIIVILILLATGLFVSYFIGDAIILSGVKREKKTAERTEREIIDEDKNIIELRTSIKDMKKELHEVRELVAQELEELKNRPNKIPE